MIDVVGDACVDLTLSVPAVPEPDQKVHTERATVNPGGVALNVAVALTRLGSEVALHARIGEDAFGSMILESLQFEAMETTHVAVDASISTYFTMSLITDDSPEKRMVVAVTPGLYPPGGRGRTERLGSHGSLQSGRRGQGDRAVAVAGGPVLGGLGTGLHSV